VPAPEGTGYECGSDKVLWSSSAGGEPEEKDEPRNFWATDASRHLHNESLRSLRSVSVGVHSCSQTRVVTGFLVRGRP